MKIKENLKDCYRRRK